MKFFINTLFSIFISINLNAQFLGNEGFMGVAPGTVISYGGDWENNGLPNVGKGKFVFCGAGAQTLTGTTTWEYLEIDNPLGVTINSGDQYIHAILYPTNGTFTTNGLLTLLSASGQTALIAGTGTGDISGDVNIQRYLAPDSALGYKHFATPFVGTAAGAEITQFSSYMDLITGTTSDDPFPTFWQYDETNTNVLFDSGWIAPTTAIMQPMVGYTANFGSDPANTQTVSLTGSVNNGAISIPVYYSNSGNANSDGWNFVGNPYPSPIDWDAPGWTKTNVVNGFSIYNATGQYTGYYGCYSGITGLGTHNTTNLIPSMRAFYVKTTANGTLGVTNSVRTLDLNPNPYFAKKTPKSNYKFLHLDVAENAANSTPDDLFIYFDSDNQTPGITKLWNTDLHIPNIFSINNSNDYLAINRMNDVNDSDVVVPIGLYVRNNNTYKITASDISNFSAETKIYLLDKSMGVTQDLTLNPDYYFNFNVNDAPTGRFYIVFSIKTDINEPSNYNQDLFSAYTNGNELFVNYYGENQGLICIYNTLGQQLHNGKVNKGINSFNFKLSHGYYFIKVISDDKSSTKKIYFNNY
ncbi:MAG TPA: T9SS type A sorting domain-containing protein [Bacteroidales bacterium]|nr:T9SS type A sorting domain-containing protein [Bacteroidales bacterium]HPS17532.1 T9SS type A sorting domain-containing protein [Bacteroidales bacterium]